MDTKAIVATNEQIRWQLEEVGTVLIGGTLVAQMFGRMHQLEVPPELALTQPSPEDRLVQGTHWTDGWPTLEKLYSEGQLGLDVPGAGAFRTLYESTGGVYPASPTRQW